MSEQFPKSRSNTSRQEHGTSEIPGGYYRYQRSARQLQAEHTGSPDIFLDKFKEQEYAQVISAAITAQKGIADLMKTNPKKAAIEQKRYEPLFTASAEAQRVLTEANLRFAAYYARASMNIVAPKDDYPAKRRRGAFGDITRLRSPYADLEERTQVANEALVKAAQTFVPKQDEKGTPISFLGHAGYRIHKALSIHAKTEEAPGWHVSAGEVEKLYAARKDPTSVDALELERLDAMDEGRQTVPIDEFTLEVVAPEEADGFDDLHALSLADVLPDPNGEPVDIEALLNLRDGRIRKVLDTLSEREAGVISMRFGLDDGTMKKLDEIAAVYGVTRERIRQIESKTMGKLRHQSRSRLLRGFVGLEAQDFDIVNPAVLPHKADGTQNIRTTYSVAHQGGQSVETAEEAEFTHKASEHMASWQVFPDEPWDIQPANERVSQTFEVTAQHLERLLYNTPPYTFQHSFAKEVASRYPIALVATINEQLGTSLTSSHIEDFWNHHINNYVASLREQLGDDFSLDRVSALFTRLLAEYMLDDDRVELHIPPELDGKLHGMGAELQTGELILYGNVGDFTGHRMNGMASIMVNGSTGDFTAFESAGYASLEVMGDAGHFAGSRLTEAAYLHVHGSVGDYCGQGLKGIDAYIEVDGNAGSHVGDNALRGVIDVRGVGESAQSNSSAVVNGEFAEWEAKDTTRVPVSLGKLAVHPPYDTEVIKRVLTPQPKDPQATIAEMEAAAQSVNPSLLEHAMPAPMQAELSPERLTFSQACEWFGVSAERLNECLEEIGHMRDSDLTTSDMGVMSELYEDLQVETVPTEGFISTEKVIEKFKIRKTPTQLLRLLAKKNVPLYKFRDVDGCVKHFISNENL